MNEMDLIRREIAKNYIDSQKGRPFIGCTIGEAMKIMLDEVPSAEPERKWISVTEALPEEKGEYLVSYHPCHWNAVSEKVVVGMDTFRGKTTWAKMKYQKVIAWMPLPEPWRGEK